MAGNYFSDLDIDILGSVHESIAIHKWAYYTPRRTRHEDIPFTHSIGFTENFNHPEILIVGGQVDFMNTCLNYLYELISNGRRFKDGDVVDKIIANFPVAFRSIQTEKYVEDMFLLSKRYGVGNYEVLQMILPDSRTGRFPSDPECDKDFAFHQTQIFNMGRWRSYTPFFCYEAFREEGTKIDLTRKSTPFYFIDTYEEQYKPRVKAEKDEIDAFITSQGWATYFIHPNEGKYISHCYALSIGFTEIFNHPEIMIVGFSQNLAEEIISRIKALLSNGARFKDGDVVDKILADHPVGFRLLPKQERRPYTKILTKRYGAKNYEVLQLGLPDPEHKFPWEKGSICSLPQMRLFRYL